MFNALTRDELINWLQTPVEAPLPRDVAHDHFLLMHPRITFLKTLPRDSIVFDIGAGDGALRGFREWLGFERRDLRFVGLSLEHGKHTSEYEEFHLCNLDDEKPTLSLQPTDVVAAQFLEHIAKPRAFLNWTFELLPAGGSIFIDWPSAHTVNLPSRAEFEPYGFYMTTLNFFDDDTHKTTYSMGEVTSLMTDIGFRVSSSGFISMPYLAESLKHYGIVESDPYLLSMAMWLKCRFASYILAQKPT